MPVLLISIKDGPRSDLSIECVTDRDLVDPEVLGQIQNRLDILRPRLEGTLALVDAEPKPEAPANAGKMRVVSAGLEASASNGSSMNCFSDRSRIPLRNGNRKWIQYLVPAKGVF